MTDYKFPSTLKLRLDWSEMDLLGHINNVMYFKYLQAARLNYGDLMGLKANSAEGEGYILAATQCKFSKPLYFPGHVTIRSSVEFMKHTSFGVYHQLMNDDGEMVAEGHDVIVLYNFSKDEKIEISADLRAFVEELEGQKYPADSKP